MPVIAPSCADDQEYSAMHARKREKERERERALLGTTVHNGGV